MDEEEARLFCELKLNANNRARFDSFSNEVNIELEEMRAEKIRICIIDVMVNNEFTKYHFDILSQVDAHLFLTKL